MARGKKWFQTTDHLSTKERVVLCVSEVGGTATLVFLGCMGCVSGIYGPTGRIPHEQISWTFGLAVMIAVQVFGHISGSHINPIVTVAAATLGNISLMQVPVYFVGQLLGALLGFGMLKTVTPAHLLNSYVNNTDGTLIKNIGVCSPAVNPLITPFQGFIVEFLATLILTLVCCGVWDPKNTDKHDSVAIRFGLAVAVLAMAAGPYTGANMNPVRSFAPALFNGDWDNHWVYWLGPLSSAFVGALLYRLIFLKETPPSEETLPEGVPLSQKA